MFLWYNRGMNETELIIGDNLTSKQERFCQNYTQNYELFGNATLSYADAYGYDLENEPDNDAQYLFNDGLIYSQHEIEDFATTDPKHISKGKKIQDSSYKRMYDLCSSYGSKLRRSEKIQKRCRDLLNEFMNDAVIDARLTEIIINGRDEHSINAIKEYNKLKQRIVEKKDITSGGEKIAGFNFIRADDENNSNN